MAARFLRLGTACAVFDAEGRVLLSRRGDLNVWNLPGGRADSGEPLQEAAAREVREETGIIAHIHHAIGLYYLAGWDRLNVLFTGHPAGGELIQRSDETRANRYFYRDEIPSDAFLASMISGAFSAVRPLPQLLISPNLRQTRWKLRRRWVLNLLGGRPEPRYPRFDISAAALVLDRTRSRVLTLPEGRTRTLPRVRCTGACPWEELAYGLRAWLRGQVAFHWVGLWQDAPADRLEFVFAAAIREDTPQGGALWSALDNIALTGRDLAYIGQLTPHTFDSPAWILHDDDSERAPDLIRMPPQTR